MGDFSLFFYLNPLKKGGEPVEKRREYALDDALGCPKCGGDDLEDDGTVVNAKCNSCGCVFTVKYVAVWQEPD